MSSKPEPAIQSRDTGQQIACCDSCQLTIAWTPKIKDIAMAVVLLSQFPRYWRTDGRTYGQSHDNQNFSDCWVSKFFKVWGSAHAPSAHRSSTTIIIDNIQSIFVTQVSLITVSSTCIYWTTYQIRCTGTAELRRLQF